MITNSLTITPNWEDNYSPSQIIYSRKYFENEISKIIISLIDCYNEVTGKVTTSFKVQFLVDENQLSADLKKILETYREKYHQHDSV